ncbi:MAG: arylsulfatase [Verrucomicrobia bacterium]|nr:arylsulfatase [Verrucomicrobiota bacterium]MDA1067498.1 arylsulfatase [Verrucomicrobiota bacterium]
MRSFRIISLTLAMLWPAGSVFAEQKPNVVLIMTDDQGYGDLSCHGNPVLRTPNIDQLHGESVRFTDFHVNSGCAPTRAALMTGRTAQRTGLWHVVMGRCLLHPDEVTLGEVFKAGGYRTALFGKWHGGDNFPYRPQDQGFDEVLTHGGGVVGHVPDWWLNDYFDDHYLHNGTWEKQNGYCTDVWIDHAIEFLAEKQDEPKFVYLPLNAPHSPFQVPEKYTEPYRNRPTEVPEENFYGMIAAIDEAIGRLDQALTDLGIRENTILIFMTDNGTSRGIMYPESGVVGFNAGMRGKKGSPYEGGHRVPCFIRWPDGGIGGGRDVDTLTTHYDLMPTLTELCNIANPAGVKLDGRSLVPLLNQSGNEWPERTIVSDLQLTNETPTKWSRTAVMTERWRLVNEMELYDIISDPGQENNLAENQPDIVRTLTQDYNRWWEDASENHSRDCELLLGSKSENPTLLTSYYWNNESGEQRDMPWAHTHVVSGPLQNGWWRVSVEQAGRYAFRLRRWPEESGLAINEHADYLEPPETSWHPVEAAKLLATRAKIQVGNIEKEIVIPPDAKVVEMVIKLPKGSARMQTWFYDDNGRSRGAYYVEVERLP